jgi:hypothetical protein
LAAKGLGQILGLQKISKKTSPVYRYSNGCWGIALPPGVALAATALRHCINWAIAACKSRAAWGEKLKETEPSTKFSVSGGDINYPFEHLATSVCYLRAGTPLLSYKPYTVSQ